MYQIARFSTNRQLRHLPDVSPSSVTSDSPRRRRGERPAGHSGIQRWHRAFGRDQYTVDGAAAVIGANISALRRLQKNGGLTGLVLNASGTLTVPRVSRREATRATYEVCSQTVPSSCDAATVADHRQRTVVNAVTIRRRRCRRRRHRAVGRDQRHGGRRGRRDRRHWAPPTLQTNGGFPRGWLLNASGTLTVPPA